MFHKFILFSVSLALLSDCSSAACRSGDFFCTNDKCIPFTWRCDKEDDCGDNSDEENCNNTACRFGEFSCNNDKCIPIKWRCDKEDDCGDWSDEENCGVPVCSPGEISCKNGRCINATLLCNGENDCGDNSDEEKCDVGDCTSGLFACSNGQCIPLPWQCDGDFDCTDKSDEENCTSTIKGKCDKETEFDCGNNTCIPIGLVCNKENDCGESEDEPSDKCFVDECLLNNGGCPQLCVDDNYGFHCECHDGYKLADDESCILERESLLYKNGSDLLILDIETGIKNAVFSGLGKPIALDYDFENDVIVWGDTLNKSIHRLNIQNGTNLFDANSSNVDTVVMDNVNPEGLAVDWIYGNVYWTDAMEESINVATLDGNLTRVLFKTNISKPRAIVVNPLEGWLFWTDWGRNPKIERAGMDGTHRSIIISENITWPNGLAIDYKTRRLFWTDAKQHSLSSSDYDGSNVKEILSSRSLVGHAFSIDVFQDSLYWNEWITKSIKRVNKFTGKNFEIVVSKVHSPSGLKVYHPLKQPKGINYCINTNSSCSHFCLPAPQITEESVKFTCFCPAGMILAHDKRICSTVE